MDFAEFGLTDVRESVTEGGVRLISVDIRPEREVVTWQALREAHGRTDLWPVLGWDAPEAAERTTRWGRPQGPAELAAALRLDPTEQMALVIKAARTRPSRTRRRQPVDPRAQAWRRCGGTGRVACRRVARAGHRPYRRRVCRQWMYWSWVRAWPACTPPACSRDGT